MGREGEEMGREGEEMGREREEKRTCAFLCADNPDMQGHSPFKNLENCSLIFTKL